MSDLLAKLPLFAKDLEIAIAVVGKANASDWKRNALPLLEAKGFPKCDALHGGRPVPLIRKWYEHYMGMHLSYIPVKLEETEDNANAWRSARERRADRKPKLKLDTRCQTVLRFMIANPKAQTQRDIKGVGEVTLGKLEKHGVIRTNGKDVRGDKIWLVTDGGRDEINRIDYWHYGKSQIPLPEALK